MPSLDNVFDLLETIKSQNIKYALITIKNGPIEHGEKTINVDYFLNLPNKKYKQICSAVLIDVLESLQKEVEKKKPRNRKKP